MAGAATPAMATTPGPGDTGGGDPYFPAAGNGGYDVGHYDLDLDYTPATRALTAHASVSATATTGLSAFSLDLRDLDVAAVAVDGVPAAFTHADGELVITPAAPLAQALRATIGDTAFAELLTAWAARDEHRPATTDDLLALTEDVSGQDLDELFEIWLYTTGKPPAG